jgi:hypothetical protein
MAKHAEVHHRVFRCTVVRRDSEHWPVRVRLGEGEWLDFTLGEAQRLGLELIKASRRKSPTPPRGRRRVRGRR